MIDILPIVSFLKETPWWVYVIFFYLVIVGFKATKTKVVLLWRLFIVPSLLIGMRVYNFLFVALYADSFAALISLFTYFLFLSVGSYLGWLIAYHSDIKIFPESNSIEIPGSWQTFILLMLIFGLKYFLGYMYAVFPEVAMNYIWISVVIVPILTGIFLGKNLNYVYRILKVNSFE